MDYMDKGQIKYYENFTILWGKKEERIILMTTKAYIYTKFNLKKWHNFIWRESVGVPKQYKLIRFKLKIPMKLNKRSLNVASSVAIILALKQMN